MSDFVFERLENIVGKERSLFSLNLSLSLSLQKKSHGIVLALLSSMSFKKFDFCYISATIQDINLKIGIHVYVNYQKANLFDKGR